MLSPTQALDLLITKIREFYFPAGVQSAWLIAPAVKSVYLFLPGQPAKVYGSGTLHDPITQFDVSLEALFK
ncbi:hypothetical protein [Hymenobacter sp. BRD67]|uniref:hypothetical protein n=1 Tax=Hymenobacter sp. BRD67 TaxID=2675877 RepID=UPI00397788DA